MRLVLKISFQPSAAVKQKFKKRLFQNQKKPWGVGAAAAFTEKSSSRSEVRERLSISKHPLPAAAAACSLVIGAGVQIRISATLVVYTQRPSLRLSLFLRGVVAVPRRGDPQSCRAHQTLSSTTHLLSLFSPRSAQLRYSKFPAPALPIHGA